MGSQQFFLLVLSVLLVSLAIFSGFQFVNSHYQNSDRVILVEKIEILYNSASKYRKSLVELGGGSGSYKGWNIPKGKLSSENIAVSCVIYSDKIIFMAKSDEIGWDNKNNIKTWVRYSDKNGKTVRFLN